MQRTIFIISDGTGITCEHFCNSLMSQFNQIDIVKKTFPYTDSLQKAAHINDIITDAWKQSGIKPIAFVTLINPEIKASIQRSSCIFLDLFGTYIPVLEEALGTKSLASVGITHALKNIETYSQRMEAIEYTITHDDGVKIGGYEQADVILIGVSRSGKTPSCLYLALQFGLLAANYPITEDDLLHDTLPRTLMSCKSKLFGLTIECERLQQIRHNRHPHSQYSSMAQCSREISALEALYHREKIPYLNSTHYSIEEITTKVMSSMGLQRKF